MDFSARFKQLRKESGLTQQDIANVVFVDKTTVSKWELGANYPNQNVHNFPDVIFCPRTNEEYS